MGLDLVVWFIGRLFVVNGGWLIGWLLGIGYNYSVLVDVVELDWNGFLKFWDEVFVVILVCG